MYGYADLSLVIHLIIKLLLIQNFIKIWLVAYDYCLFCSFIGELMKIVLQNKKLV